MCIRDRLLAAMLFCTNIAIAQGTIEDYRRAYSAGEKFSAHKVFYSNVNQMCIRDSYYLMDGFNEKSTEQVQEQQPLGCLRRFSNTLKVIIIGGLIILLMIPMFMIEDRCV